MTDLSKFKAAVTALIDKNEGGLIVPTVESTYYADAKRVTSRFVNPLLVGATAEFTEDARADEAPKMHLVFARSCGDCGGKLAFRLLSRPATDDDTRQLASELGGMHCIETGTTDIWCDDGIVICKETP